jgi:hypothetical protein
VYTGGDSLAKRALKRVLMKKQLEQMGTELRELMIYQSPPELGALWTEVNDMTKELGKEQKVLMARELEKARRRRRRIAMYQFELMLGIAILFLIFFMAGFFIWLSNDAQRRWNNEVGTSYRERLDAVRRQEWFDQQKRIQDYEEFLQQRKANQHNDSSR